MDCQPPFYPFTNVYLVHVVEDQSRKILLSNSSFESHFFSISSLALYCTILFPIIMNEEINHISILINLILSNYLKNRFIKYSNKNGQNPHTHILSIQAILLPIITIGIYSASLSFNIYIYI